MIPLAFEITDRIQQANKLRLFLDYDGTLADFAPTPDDILPDPEVIDLLTSLRNRSETKVSVISGRRLSHVRALLPVPGITLAGTYGIEIYSADGIQYDRLVREEIRPTLDRIKPVWESLIRDQNGFYLEDKGWSLAIHARYADDKTSRAVMKAAHTSTLESIDAEKFKILGGDKFIEIGPLQANKGLTVEYFLSRDPWESSISVFVGDDDKDEEAFKVVNKYGGESVVVTTEQRVTAANWRLSSPSEVRQWLSEIIVPANSRDNYGDKDSTG